MVGTPQLLTPDDASPFYELAPVPPGEMQFVVDTPSFRWDAKRVSFKGLTLHSCRGCTARHT